ncbi:DUF3598 family protein [Moorena bouillonii]|uniref:Uncharacterized protein n=1 Tax=Moorena bouillonii PNG TaxID=568701 RepID=A0A1U7MYT2_9CYAN|nr:DUF3598 family protein [Moorena bouillonii]OLT58850.1 hypothetical protein BJP37_07095 [Moorena bouillonii PNG]
MRSQWECFLQNQGSWHGSFTTFSPKGQQLKDIPSVLTIEGLDDNQKIRLTLRYLPPEQAMFNRVLEYTHVDRYLMFFDSGAFSQGALQWIPYGEFGAEFGLIEGNRRLRMVQLYNRESQLKQLTLIREKLGGTDTPERPPLTLEQLLGEWRGEAVTLYSDLQTPNIYPTHLKLQHHESNRLVQQLTFGTGESLRTITSSAKIDGSILYFDEGAVSTQVLLLPDGASSTCPITVKPGHSFFLEVGWLWQPNQRQRLIRSFNDKGQWVSLTLVREHKVSSGHYIKE